MNDDTVYITNVGRVMRGVAIVGAIVILTGTTMVIGGGIMLYKLLR
ncbi:MAG: hypothetical protein Q4F60_00205 [Candidatus Saccharibacteria bacterium]|nr:hypothetical protein [Candidatus Saccharibacteria bacterium]